MILKSSHGSYYLFEGKNIRKVWNNQSGPFDIETLMILDSKTKRNAQKQDLVTQFKKDLKIMRLTLFVLLIFI